MRDPRIFCDFCKEELTGRKYELELSNDENSPNEGHFHHTQDICKLCAAKVLSLKNQNPTSDCKYFYKFDPIWDSLLNNVNIRNGNIECYKCKTEIDWKSGEILVLNMFNDVICSKCNINTNAFVEAIRG